MATECNRVSWQSKLAVTEGWCPPGSLSGPWHMLCHALRPVGFMPWGWNRLEDTEDASGQVFYVCSDVSIPLLANNIYRFNIFNVNTCAEYIIRSYTITHMQIKPYKQSKTHVNKIKQAKWKNNLSERWHTNRCALVETWCMDDVY